MESDPRHLERLVRAVHRRAVAVRVVERAGLGIAVGAGFALLLIPVLYWRGQPALMLAVGSLVAGAVAGAVSSLRRRPTPLDAASLVDRQLRFDDLISTAWALRGRPHAGGDDAWSGTIVALASARCAAVSPSSLVLHRLNARGWGGIALAAALVLAAGLLSTSPPGTPAVASPFATDATVPDGRERARRGVTPPAVSHARPAGTDVDEGSTSKGGDDAASATAGADASARPGDRETRGDANGTGGRGAGAARTDVHDHLNPDSLTNSTADDASTAGRVRAGGGAASGEAASGDRLTGTGAAGAAHAAPRAPAAPWSSEGWEGDRSRADAAVRDGRVPDARRDLVRDYFDRQ